MRGGTHLPALAAAQNLSPCAEGAHGIGTPPQIREGGGALRTMAPSRSVAQRGPYGVPVCRYAGNTRKTHPRRTDRCTGPNGAPHSFQKHRVLTVN
eukprot:5621755-Prymnesium_polylepis.1